MKLKLLMKLSHLVEYRAYCEGYDHGYCDGCLNTYDDLNEDDEVEDE